MAEPDPEPHHAPEDEVGTLAEEVQRLWEVLAAPAGRGDRPPAARTDPLERTEPAEPHPACEHGWCPLCRGADLFRSVSPEVREHLAVAASSLVQAAAGLLATVVPDERARPERQRPDQQRPDQQRPERGDDVARTQQEEDPE